MRPNMSVEPDLSRIQALGQSFSPSAPIDTQALFAGRLNQLTEVLTALSQKGQHVVLFGERGVGKTSLARVISGIRVGEKKVPGAAVNCNSTMNFSSLWHGVMREIKFSTTRQVAGFTQQTENTLTSLETLAFARGLSGRHPGNTREREISAQASGRMLGLNRISKSHKA